MPDTPALADFARTLNALRNTVLATRQPRIISHDAKTRVAAAKLAEARAAVQAVLAEQQKTNVLIPSLPRQYQARVAMLARQKTDALLEIVETLARLEGAPALRTVAAKIERYTPLPTIRGWHDYIWPLHDECKELLEKAANGRGVGTMTKDGGGGPLLRFVANLVPRISGESPKVTTIFDYVKRNRRPVSPG